MNDHRQLIGRIEALVDRDNRPDWEDVVRRAEAPTREESPARARRSKRSYLVRRLVPAFVLAAAFIAVGLIAPWQHGPGSTVMQRAAAALGDEPILQAVLQNESASPASYIDLATGRETQVFPRTKVWYDKDRRYLFARIGNESGGVFALGYALLMTPAWVASSLPAMLSPSYLETDIPLSALIGFFDNYRSALEDGSAHVAGTGTLKGHDVTWIEWAPKPTSCPFLTPDVSTATCTERVATDKTSSLPLQIAWLHEGAVLAAVDVLSIEALPAGSFDFSKPKPTTLPADLRADGIVATDLPGVAEALPGALWSGGSISSLELTGVSRATLSTPNRRKPAAITGTGIEITEAGIELRYGNSSNTDSLWSEHNIAQTEDGRGVVIHEQKANPRAYFWPSPYAAAPAGSLLTLPADNMLGERGNLGKYFGYLEKDGIWVEIEASSRELLLEAARALVPIDGTASHATR